MTASALALRHPSRPALPAPTPRPAPRAHGAEGPPPKASFNQSRQKLPQGLTDGRIVAAIGPKEHHAPVGMPKHAAMDGKRGNRAPTVLTEGVFKASGSLTPPCRGKSAGRRPDVVAPSWPFHPSCCSRTSRPDGLRHGTASPALSSGGFKIRTTADSSGWAWIS